MTFLCRNSFTLQAHLERVGKGSGKIWELFVLLPILLHSNRSRVLSAGTAVEQLVRMLVKFREWIFDTWN